MPSTALVNDGSIFLALGAWAAWQAASSDPTLPLGAAISFCAWKLYDKRSKRSPDGPHWGGNAVWGALATTILGLVLGGLVSRGGLGRSRERGLRVLPGRCCLPACRDVADSWSARLPFPPPCCCS